MYQCAPITLLLQVTLLAGFGSEPASQVPFHLAAITASSGRGVGSALKLGLSGQKPVSMSAMITPLPALRSPPNCRFHTPSGPVRPTNRGVTGVCTVTMRDLKTCSTPGVCAIFCACCAVSLTATPLNAVSYR